MRLHIGRIVNKIVVKKEIHFSIQASGFLGQPPHQQQQQQHMMYRMLYIPQIPNEKHHYYGANLSSDRITTYIYSQSIPHPPRPAPPALPFPGHHRLNESEYVREDKRCSYICVYVCGTIPNRIEINVHQRGKLRFTKLTMKLCVATEFGEIGLNPVQGKRTIFVCIWRI